MSTEKALHPAFQKNYYLFRRKVFKLFGGAFHVYDENKEVILYSKQKAFRLKEDFRVYADESQAEELLTIKTPRILDISATYHVTDATTGEAIGALKRRGIKSILKDEWLFLSPDGNEIGKLTEKSMLSALISRFINLIPQSYIIKSSDDTIVAKLSQHFNPFVLKYSMLVMQDEPAIDRRLLIAAGVLLAAIERRQR